MKKKMMALLAAVCLGIGGVAASALPSQALLNWEDQD